MSIPSHHDSDHCTIITNIHAESATKVAAYWKRMGKFPLKLPSGSCEELCAFYKELCLDVVASPKWAQPCNSWISAPTWALIDKKAKLRQQGNLTKLMSHLIGWQIMTGLRGDRWQQAADVAENIEMHLVNGEMKEAW